MKRFSFCCVITLLAFASTVNANEVTKKRIIENFGKIPLRFTANDGQVDSKVKFRSSANGTAMFFTQEGTTFLLSGKAQKSFTEKANFAQKQFIRQIISTNLFDLLKKEDIQKDRKYLSLKLSFVNANPSPEVVGEQPLAGNTNYFIGNDPSQWRTDVPNYGKIRLRDLYKGVDLVYYGNQNQLKYDFVVLPDADPAQILLAYKFGSDEDGFFSINEDGELIVTTPLGQLIERKPYCYQLIDGNEVEVAAAYKILNNGLKSFTFSIGSYDKKYPLIIDPQITYSTFLGGSGRDSGMGISVDNNGNAYVTGYTLSPNFPATSGAYDTSYNGNDDVFICKLDGNGTALLYSTYLGGSGNNDYATDITIDNAGNAFVTGYTGSSDFPTTPGAYDRTFKGGYNDVFVCKLNASGNDLIYSTFVGGSSEDDGRTIKIDSVSNAYVTGVTYSSNYPTTSGAYDGSLNGSRDIFLSELNSSGSALLYSTYIGGSNMDEALRMVLDKDGIVYLTGVTQSTDFPTTPGAYDRNFNGGVWDAFVLKFSVAGNSLLYSTYIGGSMQDYGEGIAVDDNGYVYMAGCTWSSDFPSTSGAFDRSLGGSFDAFAVKLNPTLSSLEYATFIGGSDGDEGQNIGVDNTGYAYISGYTSSSNFFVTSDAHDQSYNGGMDIFLCKLNPAGSLLQYSTFLGGGGDEQSQRMAMDENANVYIVGSTASSGFPTTTGAYDESYNGGTSDAFVSKFAFVTNSVPNASFTFNPSSGTPSTTFTFNADSSSDAQDSVSSLQVRWDWENDGTWDTEYSTTKTATHQYSTPGEYWIKLEVKDTGGLIDTTKKRVVVSYSIVNDGYGDYVLVPAGEFLMGDNFGEGDARELPVHAVTLDSFYIGKYEVINSEFKRFMDDGGYINSAYWTEGGFGQYGSQPVYWTDSTYGGGGISGNENFPVVGVNWYESKAYCKWLSVKTGKNYRLPTEAEWEKAARGTDQRRYPWGNNFDGSYANYWGSGDPYSNLTPVGYYDGTTHGSFATHENVSPYGAYDMAGNVWEWCNDWFDNNYYSISPTNNPTGPSSGSDRILRGGAWTGDPPIGDLRSMKRSYYYPYYRADSYGFRCVREVLSCDSFVVFLPDTFLVGPKKFPGDTISIPVYMNSIRYNNQNGIYSFQMELTYNDSFFQCVGYDSSGTVLSNRGGLSEFTVKFRIDSGRGSSLDTLRIAGASDDSLYYPEVPGTPFAFPRPLIKLKFRIPTTAHNGDSTILRFTRFMFNEGIPASSTDDGSIKLRLRKKGDVDKNGIIQPIDAILVLRYVIHDTTLDAESQIAAEVSGNGEITAYDAALILMYWVGKITEFPAGNYYKRGLPSNKGADIVMEWGEVKDGIINLLVKAKNLSEVYGYSLALSYDPSILTYQGYQSSDLTKRMTTLVRNENGQLRMAVAGADPLNGEGVIVSFKFKLNSNGDLNRDKLVNLNELVLNEEMLISTVAMTSLPKTYSLEQNYPNPFNPETRIRYQILEARNVQLIVYNLLGQPVRTLVNEMKPSGVYEVRWDGKNDQGISLASGVYIYRIKAGNFVSTRKLILMK